MKNEHMLELQSVFNSIWYFLMYMNNKRQYFFGAACIILAGILRAIDYSFLRWSLYSFDPLLIVSAEHLFWVVIATIIFLMSDVIYDSWIRVWLLSRVKNLPKTARRALIGIALLWWIVATYALTKSLFLVLYDSLALPAVFQKLQPLFAVFAAVLLLKEKVSPRLIRILIVVLVWSYLVSFWINVPSWIGNDYIFTASLRALLAAACRWFQTVLARYVSEFLSFHEIAWMRLFLTAVFAWIIVLFLWLWWDLVSVIVLHRKIFFLIAILSWIFAVWLYYMGIRRVKASHATIYELSLPVSLEIFALVGWIWTLFTSYQRLWVALITWSILYLISSKKE